MDAAAINRLAQIREGYQALPMRPLRLTAVLGAPVAHYHDLHLDSILAYTVLETALEATPIATTAWIDIPLPLEVLWRDTITQVPLWASTDFAPVGASVRSATYFHRRALEPTMTKRALDTGAGRHKERRSPVPTTHTDALYADCIGNIDALAGLLAYVGSIGKKRHSLGAVREWHIDELATFSLVDDTKHARRPLPYAAIASWTYPIADLSVQGFAPPYWHAHTRHLCIPSGAVVPEDTAIPLVYAHEVD